DDGKERRKPAEQRHVRQTQRQVAGGELAVDAHAAHGSGEQKRSHNRGRRAARSCGVGRHRQTHCSNGSNLRLDTWLCADYTSTVIRRSASKESEVWKARSG